MKFRLIDFSEFGSFRLSTIYTAVNGDIKRVILRVLDIPVRAFD